MLPLLCIWLQRVRLPQEKDQSIDRSADQQLQDMVMGAYPQAETGDKPHVRGGYGVIF